MVKFLKIDGQKIDPLDYTLDIIKKYPDVKIHVGTDSHSINDNTRYITAIAYRFNQSGVHYIYSKNNFPKIIDKWERLWKETELSIEIAQILDNKEINLEIDMDYNSDEKYYSNKLVSVAKGWANSLGFKVNIKPFNQIATSAADYHSK
ncbi:MAG: hypothetical protein ISQ41_05260 [Flavobacteriaceae bacterium]|nr:hypothetical protein [Flavobacteriaceae bacterium]MBL6684854.1 hypothetical protein [Flavobacteriaceae bacterium]PDH50658.1 MAG: hypothetical protein CND00_04210 [Cryomorphaceae bacterium MED-G14]|tara:strand:- start:98 stop:544 length:447 start_codon:yes stop_codon:yes gene_type:complete